MNTCPLCNLEIDDTDLTRHYLGNTDLVRYIQSIFLTWKPKDGACSRCLEMHSRELHSKSLGQKSADEQTIITNAREIIDRDAIDMEGAAMITIHGADLGKKFTLQDGEAMIGRGENAQIRINEENVSRLHARILKRGAEVILEDQNSTNGTFVNTRKVDSTPLKDGDLILIGNTILKFISGSNLENQYHDEIYRLATMDALTQIFNRSFFVDRLEEEFGRSKRYQRDLSLILLDFDHFKSINDTYGHAAGDEVLKKASSIILRNMRKEDLCGRFGGEELAVLLPETPHDSAMRLAEKVRKLIETTAFMSGATAVKATVSLGVTTLAENQKTAKEFVEAADKALYKAKNDGRNCVRSSRTT